MILVELETQSLSISYEDPLTDNISHKEYQQENKFYTTKKQGQQTHRLDNHELIVAAKFIVIMGTHSNSGI